MIQTLKEEHPLCGLLGKGSDDALRTMLSLKSDIDINMADKYGGTGKNWQTYSAFIQASGYRWCL